METDVAAVSAVEPREVTSLVEANIPNHVCASLSELDLQIVRSVPPGGNWKNIPLQVPSKRLSQIRASFSAGKGSRSTYYGRLHPDRPSYTIGTYFNRPGNGCGIHYAQERMLSQREAARLQSFPDSFAFSGSQTAVNKQIGNAVPPLLSYQIARSFSQHGLFIDLFAGAGGLALGFVWAGWTHLLANELEPEYASTYEHNVGRPVVVGDIRTEEISRRLIDIANDHPADRNRAPVILLGGPPCQGFSTAGNRRTMNDERNHLFRSYAHILRAIRPDYFVFENVPGIANMEGGTILREVLATLGQSGFSTEVWRLRCEEFAVPQRRTRIFIVGSALGRQRPAIPSQRTTFGTPSSLFETLCPTPTVKEALDDLPAVVPGQDGSSLPYKSEPSTSYQMLMRNRITPEQFLESLQVSSLRDQRH